MKVTLISPLPDLYCYGLRMISASLKKEGHDVQMLFLTRTYTRPYDQRTMDDTVELCRSSDLVGMTVFTNFFDNVAQVTRSLKRAYNTPVIWGGIHATVRPAECLEYADFACVGEGEHSIVDLTRKMASGDCTSVPGIWCKRGEKVIQNPQRPLPTELDDLPFQDIDYRTHYILRSNGAVERMDERALRLQVKTFMTMATRGCPFKCTYCCNSTFHRIFPNQKSVRKRSVDNLIRELVEAKWRLPFVNRVLFEDDAFFVHSVATLEEFGRRFRSEVGLPLVIGGATPVTVRRDKLKVLVEAGLTHIRMGIETGSERTMKSYARKMTNEQSENAARIINEFRDRIPWPTYDIIVDNPFEKDQDSIDTLMLLSKLPLPYRLSLFSMDFFPGSDLYNRAKQEGLIQDDRDAYRKSIRSFRRTYFNRLFFLLKGYAMQGLRISPRTMAQLTDERLRQLKVSLVLYWLLRAWLIPFRLLFLVRGAFADIQTGHVIRIRRYAQARMRRVWLFRRFVNPTLP